MGGQIYAHVFFVFNKVAQQACVTKVEVLVGRCSNSKFSYSHSHQQTLTHTHLTTTRDNALKTHSFTQPADLLRHEPATTHRYRYKTQSIRPVAEAPTPSLPIHIPTKIKSRLFLCAYSRVFNGSLHWHPSLKTARTHVPPRRP